ncbi:MAG: nucleotidyl transferase AbiEii/AbiGii toxin family protein [Candidatus Micrarchaeia archaeon]
MNAEFRRRHDLVLATLKPLSEAASDAGGKFVFLGGSAVQALLPEPPRLSIDLDAYTSLDPTALVQTLSPGYDITTKRSNLPGYRFFNAKNGATEIRIDLTTTPLPAEAVLEKEIGTKTGRFNVNIASPHYLLASKLTALSLGTIGRKIDQQARFIKDFYDANSLVTEYGAPETAWRLFESCTNSENALRNKAYTYAQVTHAAIYALVKGAPLNTGSPTTTGSIGDFGQLLLRGRADKVTLSMMSIRIAAYLNAYLTAGAADAGDEIAQLEQDAAGNSLQPNVVDSYEAELGRTEDGQFLEKLKVLAPKALAYLYKARTHPA